MAKFIISQKQFDAIVESQIKESKSLKENKDGSYMAKQQLFVIATMAKAMWDKLEDGEQLEDWMESKIAQSEQGISAVVKAYLYDEMEDEVRGMDGLNYDDLVIGN